MMKIIDRYILKEFVLPFLYCGLTFFLLYLVADLFEHMDDFLQAHTSWLEVSRYYLYMLPAIYIQTAPFSLVLSLVYELGNFARHLEIIGMRACGISLKRIARPFVFLGLILSALFFYLNERVIPKTNVQLETLKKTYFEKGAVEKNKSYQDMAYSNAKENYVFYIGQLDLKTSTGKDIQVHTLNPNGSVNKLVRAQTGRWLDREWWLFNGTITRYDASGDFLGEPEKFIKRSFRIHESPLDLIREGKAGEQMNYSELKNSLSKKFGSRIPRAQLVELYSKLSGPWICFILVSIVVPIGLKIPKGGAFAVLGKTILVTLALYGSQFLSLAMGKQGHLGPVIACWLPNIIFGGLGTMLWGRLK